MCPRKHPKIHVQFVVEVDILRVYTYFVVSVLQYMIGQRMETKHNRLCIESWRDGSVVRTMGHLDSRTQGGSSPSVTLVPGCL